METLTNPLVQMADLEAVVAFARANGLVSMIDNTFASPVLCRPAELGFDLVMESATKYMNGHNDLVAGSVSGSAERIRRIKLTLDHLGGSLDPHACVLLERGLKTIGLRVRRQSANALELARFLEGRPEIEEVHYPGLGVARPACPGVAPPERRLRGDDGVRPRGRRGGRGCLRVAPRVAHGSRRASAGSNR